MLTNKLNLPQQFVDFCSQEHSFKDKRYSATTILKGVRENLLYRRHYKEIDEDVADKIWLIFGTLCHELLEHSQEANDELKETLISVDLPNGYTLSGKQDLYSESKKRITDFKTGSVWKIQFDDFEDYRKQLLIYAWMFRKLGFEVDNGEIIMILKDHSKTKAKTDPKYPQVPVYVKHFDFTEQDFNDIEQFILTKFDEIAKYESVEDDLLPICSKEERWATDTKYAVMKKGRKTAVKLFDSLEEAESMADTDSSFSVETREGTDKKCSEYCSCCEFCSYWREKYGNL